jgi:methionyl aminopeptidase
MRPVPTTIARPGYVAHNGQPSGRTLAPLTDPGAIARLRAACAAARRVLDHVGARVVAGVTTDELDAVAHDAYLAEGGYPSPLGYRGFPKSICTSVNEVVAHGIPDDRALADGDIVNCDITIYLDGMHGDCSATFLVGDVDPATRHLVEVTERCLYAAIEAVRPGGRVRDIGRAIQAIAHAEGLGIVRELVGHGIGEEFHSAPYVHHYDEPRDRTRLRTGMVFTIEPMLTLGNPDVVQWDDGWTIVTLDGQPSAQFEHTVIVTKDGVEVLTA